MSLTHAMAGGATVGRGWWQKRAKWRLNSKQPITPAVFVALRALPVFPRPCGLSLAWRQYNISNPSTFFVRPALPTLAHAGQLTGSLVTAYTRRRATPYVTLAFRSVAAVLDHDDCCSLRSPRASPSVTLVSASSCAPRMPR